ncbi:Syntaphilin/Syntabulin [Trinorchestia longiramus]|nr:Syntaphilin/Syntabulin [Trinorchestia longiramus]
MHIDFAAGTTGREQICWCGLTPLSCSLSDSCSSHTAAPATQLLQLHSCSSYTAAPATQLLQLHSCSSHTAAPATQLLQLHSCSSYTAAPATQLLQLHSCSSYTAALATQLLQRHRCSCYTAAPATQLVQLHSCSSYTAAPATQLLQLHSCCSHTAVAATQMLQPHSYCSHRATAATELLQPRSCSTYTAAVSRSSSTCRCRLQLLSQKPSASDNFENEVHPPPPPPAPSDTMALRVAAPAPDTLGLRVPATGDLSVPGNTSVDGSQASSTDANSSNDANQDLDDCESVNSLDSCSLGSCLSSCDGNNVRCDNNRKHMSGILHCGHNHDTPSFYLTPTQRAARTIRALKSRLATAERELTAKNAEITALNRQLVELRLSGADTSQASEEPRSRKQPASCKSQSAPTAGDPAAAAAAAGSVVPSCVSPSDDSSEPELQGLCRDRQLAGGAGPMPNSGSPASVSLAETTDSTELNRSLADSGHYDDLTSPATSTRDPYENSSVHGNNTTSSVKKSTSSSTFTKSTEPDSLVCDSKTSGVIKGGEGDIASSASHSDDEQDDRGDGVSETDDEMDEEEEVEDELDEEEEEEEDEWRARVEAEIASRLLLDHERALERLKQEHMNEFHEIKERHNDKVETLLSKLSDANLRYFELRPQLDRCQARVQQLETELERAKDDLAESERRHQNTYLQMFLKGQQAARLQHESECTSSGSGSRDGLPPPEGGEPCEGGVRGTEGVVRGVEGVMRGTEGTVKGLMRELAHTQDELRKLKQAQKAEASKTAAADPLDNPRNNIDPGVTLQFLKSAVYYFLTDKDNAKGHLRAIVSILGFNEAEKYAIVQMVKV